MALPMGLAPTLFPQTTGCFSIQLREQMVGSAGNAPVRLFRLSLKTLDLQSSSRIASLEIGSGSGSCTHLNEFMRLISVL